MAAPVTPEFIEVLTYTISTSLLRYHFIPNPFHWTTTFPWTVKDGIAYFASQHSLIAHVIPLPEVGRTLCIDLHSDVSGSHLTSRIKIRLFGRLAEQLLLKMLKEVWILETPVLDVSHNNVDSQLGDKQKNAESLYKKDHVGRELEKIPPEHLLIGRWEDAPETTDLILHDKQAVKAGWVARNRRKRQEPITWMTMQEPRSKKSSPDNRDSAISFDEWIVSLYSSFDEESGNFFAIEYGEGTF